MLFQRSLKGTRGGVFRFPVIYIHKMCINMPLNVSDLSADILEMSETIFLSIFSVNILNAINRASIKRASDCFLRKSSSRDLGKQSW